MISEEDVEKVLDMGQAIDAVESAFLAYARGVARMPAKVYLDLPEFDGDFRAMPSYLPDTGYCGVKWVNSHPSNSTRGLPSVLAVYILNDPRTGVPLAVIEASRLTTIRTGAAGGVAVRALARKKSSRVSFVGCGTQAYSQFEAVSRVVNVQEVRLFDMNNVCTARLAAWISGRGVRVEQVDSVRRCVETADIIVTTTPSRNPVIQKEWVRPGTHINAIGADAPGKQELDPELVRESVVVVDDREQAFHSGEVNVPIRDQIISEEEVRGTLGDVLTGRIPGRQSDDQITIFDSTGLAIQDLVCASLVYETCRERGSD